MVTDYVVWSPDPVIFSYGMITVRWYGALFALGLILSGYYVWRRFKAKGYPRDYFESLMVWAFFGIFIGARLCHCIFYEPDYYFSHPLEMFFPVKQMDDGAWRFIGYYGLASHGGAIGLVIILLLFKLQKCTDILPIMDDVAIAVPLTGSFIRMGNFINSEIVGSVTDVPWAVVFPAVDFLPRHPAQLYESVFYLSLFIVISVICWKRAYDRVRPGFYMGVIFMAVAMFRFLIEFVKEAQVGFERGMTLNVGQWLSVPFFIAGIGIIFFTQQQKRLKISK